MNTAELRDQIIKDLDSVRLGKVSKGEARVIIGMHRNLIESMKVDLAYAASGALNIVPVEFSLPDTKVRKISAV